MRHSDIIQELQAAGASKQDAIALQKFAKKLPRQYKHPRLSGRKKRAIAKEIGIGREWFAMRTIAVAAYAAVAAIIIMPVVIGQFSLPGDPLYFVKRGTEKVRGVVQPGYADKEAERREAEVNALKATGASDDTIKKAEDAVKSSSDSSGSRSSDDSSSDDSRTTHSSTNTQNNDDSSSTETHNQDDDDHRTPSSSTIITKDQATTIAKAKMLQESPSRVFDKCELTTSSSTKVYECRFNNGAEVIVRASDGYVVSFKK